MPAVEASHIIFIASIFEILVQAFKGPFPEDKREYIPYALIILGLFLGLSLGVYYHTEPVAALFEGFFGAATALGFYKAASGIPGVNKIVGEKGWIADAQ